MLCLTRPTDPSWIARALADLPALLVDHAHCEMKAASNALAMAARSPDFPVVVRALTALAEEEIRHFRMVLDELDRRGIPLRKPPVDEYAAELRRVADRRRPRTPSESVVDRLLVGALIEARSCERFKILAEALRAGGGDEALAAFYEDLFAAEARHFRTFVDLAEEVDGDPARVRARLDELARAEGELVDRLEARAAIHG